MRLAARLSRNLRLGGPGWLAILLFPFIVFAVATFREREWSYPARAEGAGRAGRGSGRGPAERTLLLRPPAFGPAADEWRMQLQRLTNVLIALTVVLVGLSVILLTH